MSEEAARDGYKSHVLVSSVYVYEQGNACRSKKCIFTNSLFHPEDEVSAADLPIDWVSNSSKSTTSSHFLRVKSTQSGGILNHNLRCINKDFCVLNHRCRLEGQAFKCHRQPFTILTPRPRSF